MMLTPAQYAAEMRRLESMLNEARRRSDGSAVAMLHLLEEDVNRTFWGRPLRRNG